MSEKKKFRFFAAKERKDAVAEPSLPTLGFYFKHLWRKLGKLISLNLMMMMRFAPLIAVFFLFLFGRQTPTVESPLFAPLAGANMADGNPVATVLLGVYGKQQETAFPTTLAIVIMIVLLAFTAITWGWQTVGSTYNLRSLVRGDSCFLWSDYFYAIKRNWKQGLIFGLIDFAAIGLLLFDWYYFNFLTGNGFGFDLMYFFTIALVIIYALMRAYIYPMMITFDLSVKKLLKNALIFAMLGLKRNIMALLGIVLIAGLNIALILPSLSVGFTLPLILPVFYLPAFAGFTLMYAAYPNIRRYMIDGKTELNSFYADAEEETEVLNKEIDEEDAIPTPPTAD